MASPSKSVFVSCAEADQAVALQLHSALTSLLGEDVWIRDLDLDGGDIVIEAINDAVSDAKWFVILISKASVTSKYLRLEADWASFRALQDLGVRIIVVRLDNSALPKHLEVALGSQEVVNVASSADLLGDFIQIAEYIDKHVISINPTIVYVDRGEKSDEFALTARRNQIIFILGLAGIGKSAFVLNSIAERLKKRSLVIKLTRGHSSDLLCRQIVQRAHTVQPSPNASDEELLALAVSAVQQRADRFFIFLDNAEVALDASGQLLPFLQSFLIALLRREVKTHVILATTRNPDLIPDIAAFSDVLKLDGLAKKYIREQIELLLGEGDRTLSIMNTAELSELVTLVGGHPLAAKLLASFLKVKTPQQLQIETEWHHFELKLARYVLQVTDAIVLNDAEKLLLQVLATVREPMLFEDVVASRELATYGINEVHAARSRLVDLFLIEQTGELMALHPFLYTFFEDQLKELPTRRDEIATDVGTYAMNKAVSLNDQLKVIYEDRSRRESPEAVRASSDVLRYAVPAGRLLRSVGKEELANELPIQIKGTLRDMVFFFYQEKRDFKKALEYAERWLAISPNDVEIMLQSARCYRNFRNVESLLKAQEILDNLESFPASRYLTARIYREKALVREYLGDRQGARELFNRGINLDLTYPYIENYVGLANLLLKEADELPEYSLRRQALVRRAVEFLEKARQNQLPLFDRLHLGTYAEALIEAGREEVALPLLRDALRNRPHDERLNHRMAEILRKHEEYDVAFDYAIQSQKYGHPKAPVTIANVMYGQAQRLFAAGKTQLGNDKLREALMVLANFQPQYGSDQEVADTISAKIYRTLGEFNTAIEFVAGYTNTSNPYTIYEQCRLDLLKAQASNFTGKEKAVAVAEARQRAKERIMRYQQEHRLPEPLQNLFNDLENESQGAPE